MVTVCICHCTCKNVLCWAVKVCSVCSEAFKLINQVQSQCIWTLRIQAGWHLLAVQAVCGLLGCYHLPEQSWYIETDIKCLPPPHVKRLRFLARLSWYKVSSQGREGCHSARWLIDPELSPFVLAVMIHTSRHTRLLKQIQECHTVWAWEAHVATQHKMVLRCTQANIYAVLSYKYMVILVHADW